MGVGLPSSFRGTILLFCAMSVELAQLDVRKSDLLQRITDSQQRVETLSVEIRRLKREVCGIWCWFGSVFTAVS